MQKIKTHETNTTIRTLDKGATLPRHIDKDFIQTKEEVEKTQKEVTDSQRENTEPVNKRVGHIAVKRIRERGKAGYAETGTIGGKGDRQKATIVQKLKKSSKKGQLSRFTKLASDQIKTAGKGLSSTATGDTAQSLQPTEQAKQFAVQSAKTAMKTLEGFGTAKRSGKFMLKYSKKAVKAIIQAFRSVIGLMMGGGAVAVFIVVLITIIGLMFNSIFGIFFTGEKSPDKGSFTMAEAIADINDEYNAKIEKIEKKNKHDKEELSGGQANWEDVLAIYSVKTVNDNKSGQAVSVMNKAKKNLLRKVFWDMHKITSKVKTLTSKEVETVEDGNGGWKEKEKTVTTKILYIHVKHLSLNDMAKKYGLNEEQRAQVKELRSEKYAKQWEQVLSGVAGPTGSVGSKDIVEIAKKQLGNVGGRPYWSWYGFNSRVEWCACFVSWCANQAGYIKKGVIPKFAACHLQGVPWFKARNRFKPRGYKPKPGDIIFFDWQPNGWADHVGIVEKYQNGTVYTIEGNSHDTCKRKSYPLNSVYIHGYGVPAY